MIRLCVSLLRLGDFYHHVHLLKNMDGDIHVLAFDEVKPAAKLFPEYKFHFISRAQLQFELVEKHRNWRRALYLLQKEIAPLQKIRFDEILNLTHTNFAARCLDLIKQYGKKGAHFENGKLKSWNPVLQYINEIWKTEDTPLMNWLEVTALSLSLPEPRVMTASQPQSEAREIWLQTLTSDTAKNWDVKNWQRLIRLLKTAHYRPVVICAPSEEESLVPHFGADLKVMSFADIRDQKANCRALISADTSVLHFGVLEGIPIHGIYLGPANPYKTPPRQVGALIWQGEIRAEDILASLIAGEQGVDLTRIDGAPFGFINSFGRYHRRGTEYDNVETTRKLPAEGARASGGSHRSPQEDAGL